MLFRSDWGGGPQAGAQHMGYSGGTSGGYDQGSRGAQGRQSYAEGGYGRDQGYGSGRQYEGYSRNQHHHGDQHAEDRSWMDKARDEVGSWFGDEEAERRRRMDAAQNGHSQGYESRRDDTGWSDRFSSEDRYRSEQPSDRRDRWNRSDW